MSLRDESTTGVDDNTATISEFVVINSSAGSSNGAESKSLIGAKLICREAIM